MTPAFVPTELLTEILRWSRERPAWQRDALRRIVVNGQLAPSDIGDLAELAKASHGLAPQRAALPLDATHIASGAAATTSIALVRLCHHDGVNALAMEQTVQFGPVLTVVYGNNAAGKSGYTRILKQACRSRASEGIIGNVLSGSAPVVPRATIVFRDGATERTLDWDPGVSASAQLGAVSIFDGKCTPVYLRDKTDVAFRPFGLDVLDALATACAQVRAVLEKERSQLVALPSALPTLPDNTAAGRLVKNLTSLTSPDEVRSLATLTVTDEGRLAELQKLRNDYEADEPKRRARDLTMRADRIESLVAHLNRLVETLGVAGVTRLAAHRKASDHAQERLAAVRASLLTADLLPATGGPDWKRLWQSAEGYALAAYPQQAFPPTEPESRCALCQEPLGKDGVARLQRFASFVTSTAQVEAAQAAEVYECALQSVRNAEIEPASAVTSLEDLQQEDVPAAEIARAILEDGKRVRSAIEVWAATNTDLPEGCVRTETTGILPLAAQLRSRAEALRATPTGMQPDLRAELAELDARTALRGSLGAVLEAIDRKKRVAAYGECVDDVVTNAITKKSTELTKLVVTDALQTQFKAELKAIGFTHVAVEVQAAGGSKGALYHKLVFTHAPSVAVAEVLSEGEARALSVAAFLTELTTAATASAIVFDDPVSSLDHVWRERIARRLVSEAAKRQVVVFTHDVLFLHFLADEAEHQGVDLHHQYIRRDKRAGICVPDVPWFAMRIKDRIGVLKARVQQIEKTFREAPGTYESVARDLYGLLREAWEQAVGEVLLNEVVVRYRPSIETKRALKLHDITKEDCEQIDTCMTKCSRWIRGHDAAPTDGTPLPEPTEIKADVATLESWVSAIRKRRD